MKTLKKLLCGALSLSLVLALAACGSQPAEGGEQRRDRRRRRPHHRHQPVRPARLPG